MVQHAPLFATLAPALYARLQGALFIAHNARFDYGFLRNAFSQHGYQLRADVLCTVKLSRKLFPKESKHNLDTLVSRHSLASDGRHRALADADLIWQFWKTAGRTTGGHLGRCAAVTHATTQFTGAPAQRCH